MMVSVRGKLMIVAGRGWLRVVIGRGKLMMVAGRGWLKVVVGRRKLSGVAGRQKLREWRQVEKRQIIPHCTAEHYYCVYPTNSLPGALSLMKKGGPRP